MKAYYEKHTSHHYKNSEMPFIFHTDTVCDFENNYSRLHWHENIEVLYCREGEGEVFSDAKRIEMKPQSIIVINSSAPHTVFNKNSKGVEYDCLIIDFDFCRQNGIDLQKTVFDEQIISERGAALFKEAFAGCGENQDFHSLAARTAVLCFLLYMCKEHSKQRQNIPIRSSVEHIKKAVIFIKENYANPITLEETAVVSGFSMYYFSREFKIITGHTFTDFLNLVRCDKAERLLREGKSVTEVALSCGFKDISYFSKTFKKIKGKNPSEIKK